MSPRSIGRGGKRVPAGRARPARAAKKLVLSRPAKRMHIALMVMVIFASAIGWRLIDLQGVNGSAYAATAESARLKEKVLPAQRGAIVDVHGTQLAYTVTRRTLFADPAEVVPETKTDLAALISDKVGVDYSSVLAALSAKGRYAVIATDVDPQVADDIAYGTLNGEPIRGIGAEVTQKRIYPSGDVAGQVVGFTTKDQADGAGVEGLAGIEQSYDATLAGEDGLLVYEASPFGQVIPAGVQEETPATPGSTVQLTLDADIEYLVQQAVASYEASKPAAAQVSVVALDVHTGQVVAMYSSPGYDPSNPGAVNGDDLANATVSSVIEPGSVNKVTTFGPALDEGIVTPSTVFTVPGSIKVADVVVHDAWDHGDVNYTATGILAKSSNVGTLMVNEKLDPQDYYDALLRFGLGKKTGIELPAESRGILAPREDWSGSQAGNVPIGQGVSVTPLQLASMYQAIANDGVRIPPRIVKQVIAPDGTVTPGAPAQPEQVISEKSAKELISMLEAVTGPGGTGTAATIPGYRVAGKSGTGQRANPNCNCYAGGGYNHTFVGMAPVEDPQYVVAVAITDPTASVGGGAAPLFATVMGQILQSRAVPPSKSESPEYTLIAG